MSFVQKLGEEDYLINLNRRFASACALCLVPEMIMHYCLPVK